MSKKRSFQIPEDLLAKISEMTSGGFILFLLDEDDNPRMHSRFDTKIHATALQTYVANWVRAMDNLTQEMASAAILRSRPRPRRRKGPSGESATD